MPRLALLFIGIISTGCSAVSVDTEMLARQRAQYLRQALPVTIGPYWLWKVEAVEGTVRLRAHIEQVYESSVLDSHWQGIHAQFCQLKGTHYAIEQGVSYQVVFADSAGFPLKTGTVNRQSCAQYRAPSEPAPSIGHAL